MTHNERNEALGLYHDLEQERNDLRQRLAAAEAALLDAGIVIDAMAPHITTMIIRGGTDGSFLWTTEQTEAGERFQNCTRRAHPAREGGRMRPSWCPHADCKWAVGGPMQGHGEPTDSGMVCGGFLPIVLDHAGTTNTHRICFKPCDSGVVSLECNSTDLWYIERKLNALRGASN